MERAVDRVTYIDVHGVRQDYEVLVYSLSTCAFCKRAIDYLASRDVHFQYVQLDTIDIELKRAIKRELAERFDNIVVFPILVVDDQRAYSGFIEATWARALDIA